MELIKINEKLTIDLDKIERVDERCIKLSNGQCFYLSNKEMKILNSAMIRKIMVSTARNRWKV